MSARYLKPEKDHAAGEAYLQLAAAADRFEQYAKPHATRVAAIADALAEAFHIAPQDRRSLRAAASGSAAHQAWSTDQFTAVRKASKRKSPWPSIARGRPSNSA